MKEKAVTSWANVKEPGEEWLQRLQCRIGIKLRIAKRSLCKPDDTIYLYRHNCRKKNSGELRSTREVLVKARGGGETMKAAKLALKTMKDPAG